MLNTSGFSSEWPNTTQHSNAKNHATRESVEGRKRAKLLPIKRAQHSGKDEPPSQIQIRRKPSPGREESRAVSILQTSRKPYRHKMVAYSVPQVTPHTITTQKRASRRNLVTLRIFRKAKRKVGNSLKWLLYALQLVPMRCQVTHLRKSFIFACYDTCCRETDADSCAFSLAFGVPLSPTWKTHHQHGKF